MNQEMLCSLSNGSNRYKHTKNSSDVDAKMMAASYRGAGLTGGLTRNLTVLSDIRIPGLLGSRQQSRRLVENLSSRYCGTGSIRTMSARPKGNDPTAIVPAYR